jgi:acetyl-CoA carboxylase biotin carboxyl carrier protein
MSEQIRNTSAEHLRDLCQEAIALVHSLPGPVRRVAVRTSDHAIEVEWPTGDAAPVPMVAAPPSADVSRTLTSVPEEAPTTEEVATHVIRAPLVGTFYRGPRPDADPFVTEGEIVEAGQTVAIVEAMKLLNNIATEVAGRVVEICASDGEPVEFEQSLIHILPLVDDQAVLRRVQRVYQDAHR